MSGQMCDYLRRGTNIVSAFVPLCCRCCPVGAQIRVLVGSGAALAPSLGIAASEIAAGSWGGGASLVNAAVAVENHSRQMEGNVHLVPSMGVVTGFA